MLNIKEKLPFLTNYFENAVKNKRTAHCILFYGSDILAQYNLALEIARMLNCTGIHDFECSCLNCSWIRENKHPAVLTISRLDNKPSDDKSKTVISIEQARRIKNDLLITSQYHRVLIFCDRDKYENLSGLNEQNFQAETANALLKTLEEPPSNTTFFFLAKDKSDLINTIISRSQSFYVPSIKEENRDYELVEDIMDGYLELERSKVLDFNEKINSLLKYENPDDVFTQMQNYIEMLLKSCDNCSLKIKLIADLKAIEKAKKENDLNMNIQTIVETLSLKLIL